MVRLVNIHQDGFVISMDFLREGDSNNSCHVVFDSGTLESLSD